MFVFCVIYHSQINYKKLKVLKCSSAFDFGFKVVFNRTLVMEEYSARKRKHSSSDEDDLDLDLDIKEQAKKLRENTKAEPEDINVKEEPGTSDASLSEQSKSFKSESAAIKEEIDDKYSDFSDDRIRRSLDSDSDDDHANADR